MTGMNYRRFLPSANTTFKIDDHLIECGRSTWQIRNIAATSVGRNELRVNDPEPRFGRAKPKLNLNPKPFLWATGLTWLATRLISGDSTYAFWGGVLAASGVVAWAFRALTVRKEEWLADWHRFQKVHQLWQNMRTDPPVVFSLMLETNAGSKPLFYSFEESQIEKANHAIKISMAKKAAKEISFQIETLNVGGDQSINNFGSSIYHQALREVSDARI